MITDNLVTLAHELARLGYCPGGSGNISARDGDDLLISPTGVSLASLRHEDLVRCSIDWSERAVLRDAGRASKEIPMHIALHARRPETNGFVGHVHSPFGVAASCIPAHSDVSAIPFLTPYFAMKVGAVPLIDYAEPGSQSQADEIFHLEPTITTLLMQNHGLSAWSASIEGVVDQLREAEITSETWIRIRGQEGIRTLDSTDQLTLKRKFR